MNRKIRNSILALIAIGSLAIYPLFLKYTFRSVLESQYVGIDPKQLQLVESTGVQAVDLGYVKFNLPGNIVLNPHILEDFETVALNVSQEEPENLIIKGPQLSLRNFGDLDAIYGDDKPKDLWSFYKKALNTKPLTTWNVYFRGRRFIEKMVLELSLKALLVSPASEFYVYEDKDRGAIIKSFGDSVWITVIDRDSGNSVSILLEGDIEANLRAVSSLLTSLKFLVGDPQSFDVESLNLPSIRNTQQVGGADSTR
jgi:hypothetical protein